MSTSVSSALEYAIERARRISAGEREVLGDVPSEFTEARRRVAQLVDQATRQIRVTRGTCAPVSAISAFALQSLILHDLATIGALICGERVKSRHRRPIPVDSATARSVPCPRCGAPSGKVCRSPAGHDMRREHLARREAAP